MGLRWIEKFTYSAISNQGCLFLNIIINTLNVLCLLKNIHYAWNKPSIASAIFSKYKKYIQFVNNCSWPLLQTNDTTHKLGQSSTDLANHYNISLIWGNGADNLALWWNKNVFNFNKILNPPVPTYHSQTHQFRHDSDICDHNGAWHWYKLHQHIATAPPHTLGVGWGAGWGAQSPLSVTVTWVLASQMMSSLITVHETPLFHDTCN